MTQNVPLAPDYKCPCGAFLWWYRRPGSFYNIPNPGGWVCGRCHPAPELVEADTRGKKGRPRLTVGPGAICDALKTAHNVKAAAASLGISRAYVYKALGVDKVHELTRWEPVA